MRCLDFLLLLLLSSSCCGFKLVKVNFKKDIYPITSTVCESCHFEPGKNWEIYNNAYQFREDIYQKVVIEKIMPLGIPMSDDKRELFKEWIQQGARP